MAVRLEIIPVSDSHRLKSLGGPARVAYELQDFQKRIRYLDANHAELVKRYPDQVVALTSNGTLVAAPTVEELVEKLERKGLDRSGAATKLMETTPRMLIL